MKKISRRLTSLMILLVVIIIMTSGCIAPQTSPAKVIVFPLATEPPILNPYLSNSGWEAIIDQMIHESLASVAPDGVYYPVLASEIPTRENGGVSDDGLTITWKLKHNVKWSDGKPFTSADVKFTWEAASHPESGVIWNPGVDQIEMVETPDDYTTVIKYRAFYPDYLGQFSSNNSGAQGILPKHICGEPKDMTNWKCNRAPIGTGPFMLEEWKSGEFLSLVRNPNYREAGKPYIDKILMPIVPDSTSQYQMLLNGDAHVWWFVDQQYLKELLNSDSVKLSIGSQQYVLRLFLNLNQRETNGEGKPHPFLSDLRVRQAIRLTIDPVKINKNIYYDLGKVVQHEMFHGRYKCDEPELPNDPDAAKRLLDEAGFVDKDGNGIRECHSCQYASEGTELELSLITSNDEPPLSFIQQVIADELQAIGVKINPSLEASFEESAILGDFDIMMWPDGYDPTSDPAYFVSTYYKSKSIPEYNIMRYKNPQTEDIFKALETEFEPNRRKNLFCQLDKQITENVPLIFLVAVPYPSALSNKIVGWQDNPNAVLTWDAANWQLVQPSH